MYFKMYNYDNDKMLIIVVIIVTITNLFMELYGYFMIKK